MVKFRHHVQQPIDEPDSKLATFDKVVLVRVKEHDCILCWQLKSDQKIFATRFKILFARFISHSSSSSRRISASESNCTPCFTTSSIPSGLTWALNDSTPLAKLQSCSLRYIPISAHLYPQGPNDPKHGSFLSGQLPRWFYRNRQPWIFNTGLDGIDFTRHPAYKVADIVHLHWVSGLVATRTLRKMDKPALWTMRDMWPFTGGCHYSMGCERYESGCGACPQLGSNTNFDLSRLVVWSKRRYLSKRTRIVGISRWLSECAKRSAVLQDFEIQTISNNVDTREFYPVDPVTARKALGLPLNKKIVLAGAQSLSDFYKGFDLFREALAELRSPDVHILLVGNDPSDDFKGGRHTASSLVFLNSVESIRLAYSAADVFVAPSRMEAFGKMLVEAMACGTPVVCFDSTGPADIVEHKVTGYKAVPFRPVNLAEGIDWCLSLDQAQARFVKLASRARAVSYFDSAVIAAKYVQLYKEILASS